MDIFFVSSRLHCIYFYNLAYFYTPKLFEFFSYSNNIRNYTIEINNYEQKFHTTSIRDFLSSRYKCLKPTMATKLFIKGIIEFTENNDKSLHHE